jgi:S1-C subfamily serine protease
VNFQEVTPDIAEGLGIDRPQGALVADVTTGSPGARAGLTTGDLVTSIDGIEVDHPKGLNYLIATKALGDTAKLGVVRGGRKYVASLTLEAAPETVPRDDRAIDGQSPFAGATVVNLSPAVAEELAYPGKPEGVIISAVTTGSQAHSAGFVRGDVVVEVNGVRVQTTKVLVEVAGQQTRSWRLVIERNGRIIRSQLRG